MKHDTVMYVEIAIVVALALLVVALLPTVARADRAAPILEVGGLDSYNYEDQVIMLRVKAAMVTSGGIIIQEDVRVHITTQPMRDQQTVGTPATRVNATLRAGQRETLRVGRLPVGPYELVVHAEYGEGETERARRNIVVQPRPVPHSVVFLRGGQRVHVLTRAENETLDVVIVANHGVTQETLVSRADVMDETFRIDTTGAVSITVRVADRHNITTDHTHMLIADPATEGMRLVVALTSIGIAIIIGVVAVWRVGKKEKKKGFSIERNTEVEE